MKAELLLFGMHFNMAPRANRRRLMALIYAAFAALMAAGWFVDRWRLWSTSLVIFSAGYVGRLVLGGYGAGGKGMIKPFLGNQVRARYARNPNSRWSQLARRTIPEITDEREFCSDEREVSRTNGAHEAAYRRLGIVIIFTFLIAYVKNAALPLLKEVGVAPPPEFFDFFDQIIYGLLISSFILLLTLPQAILLWTEPDIDEEEV